MQFLDVILPWIHAFGPLISYLIGTVSQETLIFLSILAGAGDLPLWVVGVFGFLGAMTHDTVMYFVGRKYLGKYIVRALKVNQNRRVKGAWIEKIREVAHDNTFLVLFFSKFIYGVRLATIWYVAKKERNYWTYMHKDIPAIICGLAVMLPLGWLAGKGFTLLFNLFLGVRYAVFAAILVWILYLIIKWLAKRKAIKNITARQKRRKS